MLEKQRYFFRKADKLKSRKVIESVFTKGKQFSIFPFKVFWLTNPAPGSLQAGVSVSSRNFKKATSRNRIKRLMREAYRLQKQTLNEHLIQQQLGLSVFFLYVGKELPDFSAVSEKMELILARLKKLTDGKPEAHT